MSVVDVVEMRLGWVGPEGEVKLSYPADAPAPAGPTVPPTPRHVACSVVSSSWRIRSNVDINLQLVRGRRSFPTQWYDLTRDVCIWPDASYIYWLGRRFTATVHVATSFQVSPKRQHSAPAL